MLKIEKGVGAFCKAIAQVSMWASFGIVFVLAADIVLRLVTVDKSILGTYEITEMAMIAIIYLALAVTQFEKENIHVVMLIERFPWRVKTFIEGGVSAFATVVCAIFFYASFLQTQTVITNKLTTQVLFIPHYPFTIIMTIGFGALAVVIALETINYFIAAIKNIKPEESKEELPEESAI